MELCRYSWPSWFTTGCGVFLHTRPVEDQYSKVPLKESSQQGLIDSINQQADSIQSLKATVDIDSSVGGMKKGHVTDYKEIRGYVLARKPDALHMIGLMPIVRTTAFDMVSDGTELQAMDPAEKPICDWQERGCDVRTRTSRWRTFARRIFTRRC